MECLSSSNHDLVFFLSVSLWCRPVVFESEGGSCVVRCEKRQYLDKPLRLARPSARQYQGLATLWLLSQRIHMGKGTLRMSSEYSRRAYYIAKLTDETN